MDNKCSQPIGPGHALSVLGLGWARREDARGALRGQPIQRVIGKLLQGLLGVGATALSGPRLQFSTNFFLKITVTT